MWRVQWTGRYSRTKRYRSSTRCTNPSGFKDLASSGARGCKTATDDRSVVIGEELQVLSTQKSTISHVFLLVQLASINVPVVVLIAPQTRDGNAGTKLQQVGTRHPGQESGGFVENGIDGPDCEDRRCSCHCVYRCQAKEAQWNSYGDVPTHPDWRP